ncbi:MAG: hypothetical protein Q7R33_04900 [Nitrosarchaeum sp.]|nr:hypothetical protein [Nitrosarchaeum sp.]
MQNKVVPAKLVPITIKDFVFSKLQHNLRKFTLDTSGKVKADIPWHEADREYYQLFKFNGFHPEMVPFSFSNSGWSEGSHSGEGFGEAEIPEGHVMVMVGIYPKRCTIYTPKDINLLSIDSSVGRMLTVIEQQKEKINPDGLMFKWEYDARLEAYVFGISNHGGGVFEDDDQWFGNSVIQSNDNIINFGPCATMLEAQKAVEEDFQKRSNGNS